MRRIVGVRVACAPSGVGRKPIRESPPGTEYEVCPKCGEEVEFDLAIWAPVGETCWNCGNPKPWLFSGEYRRMKADEERAKIAELRARRERGRDAVAPEANAGTRALFDTFRFLEATAAALTGAGVVLPHDADDSR